MIMAYFKFCQQVTGVLGNYDFILLVHLLSIYLHIVHCFPYLKYGKMKDI
jgi:hypothetical protein